MRAHSTAALVGVGLVCALAFAACGDSGGVRLTFRPPVGAHYRYELHVRSRSTLTVAGLAARHDEDDAVLQVDDTVLDTGGTGVRVRVVLRRAGSPDRTFVVRFDRAGQLQRVERVEGLPASVLGALGLPEIFPGAGAAPPSRPVVPGQRWSIHRPLVLPDQEAGSLTGWGQLVDVALAEGHRVATVRSHTRSPLDVTTDLDGGPARLTGTEVSDTTSTRDLRDGAVARATATTDGTFAVTLSPPAGTGGSPLSGRLVVHVQSTTRRLSP